MQKGQTALAFRAAASQSVAGSRYLAPCQSSSRETQSCLQLQAVPAPLPSSNRSSVATLLTESIKILHPFRLLRWHWPRQLPLRQGHRQRCHLQQTPQRRVPSRGLRWLRAGRRASRARLRWTRSRRRASSTTPTTPLSVACRLRRSLPQWRTARRAGVAPLPSLPPHPCRPTCRPTRRRRWCRPACRPTRQASG